MTSNCPQHRSKSSCEGAGCLYVDKKRKFCRTKKNSKSSSPHRSNRSSPRTSPSSGCTQFKYDPIRCNATSGCTYVNKNRKFCRTSSNKNKSHKRSPRRSPVRVMARTPKAHLPIAYPQNYAGPPVSVAQPYPIRNPNYPLAYPVDYYGPKLVPKNKLGSKLAKKTILGKVKAPPLSPPSGILIEELD